MQAWPCVSHAVDIGCLTRREGTSCCFETGGALVLMRPRVLLGARFQWGITMLVSKREPKIISNFCDL